MQEPNPGYGVSLSEGIEKVDFYVDVSTLEIKQESDTDETNIAVNNRVEHAFSAITTPNDDTLDNYTNVEVSVEYYFSGDATWHKGGWAEATTAAGYGLTGDVFDDDQIYVQSGSAGLFFWGNRMGGSKVANTGSGTPSPCRIRIKALK